MKMIHYYICSSSSVTAILRKLKQQSRETVEDKRPKLLNALKEVKSHSVAFSENLRWIPSAESWSSAS